jgi:hypothetical protein
MSVLGVAECMDSSGQVRADLTGATDLREKSPAMKAVVEFLALSSPDRLGMTAGLQATRIAVIL